MTAHTVASMPYLLQALLTYHRAEEIHTRLSQLFDLSTVARSAAICVANSNRYPCSILEGLESFSNWKNLGVIHQSASATMIEYCLLPEKRNPMLDSTGIIHTVTGTDGTVTGVKTSG